MAEALGRGLAMGASRQLGGQWVPREWPVAPEMLAIANEGMAAATAMPIDSSGEEQ